MGIDAFPTRVLALNLANRLHSRLAEPRILSLKESRFYVEGGLLHPKLQTRGAAHCWFIVPDDWMRRIPTVGCKEQWVVKGDADWHTYADGSLCIDHRERWEQYILNLADRHPFHTFMLAATEWIINSTASLLGRHMLKSQGFVTTWDPAWDFWEHGEGSAKQNKTFIPDEASTSQ